MIIENPVMPEGINVSKIHPLAEMVMLLTGVIAVGFALTIALAYVAGYFADQISFETEVSMIESFADKLPGIGKDADPAAIAIQEKLQGLADRIAVVQELPEGMEITVHYSEDDVVNAFATLGGHIFIYKGLIDQLESENSLAMVVAHEIAHIKNRDPIRSLARAVGVSLAFAMVLGSSESGGSDELISSVSTLTSLDFSRSQETDADEIALASVMALYGHVQGSTDLFNVLLAMESEVGVTPPEFLSTHPVSTNRIHHLDELADQGGWTTKGELMPINQYTRDINK